MDIAFTYAKMTGRHLKVGTSRRAAEVATCLAMMVNEDEDGRTGIPKGTKARALTLEELADKKRQRAHQPLGARLMSSHFRTVIELKEEINIMAKKTKAAAANAETTAVGTTENTGATGEGSEGATGGEDAGNAGSDTQEGASNGEAAKAKRKPPVPPTGPAKDMLLFFKKHPERNILPSSLRYKIMVQAYKTGGKIKLFDLNTAMGQTVRSDVKTLIKLEHCVEVTQEQFDALPSEALEFVAATKTSKPVPPKAKPKAKPDAAATGEAVTTGDADAAATTSAAVEEAPL